ncbi:MAG: hemolysin family protein [Xanthomonadales bacterium]|jgi:CBS domain containing-hemolysin-like protein|nr:hemolysin family protein [Xanthomonadales bacterium]
MYTLLIAFFSVSIVVSFLCSLWEATLLSITPSYAQLKLNEGTRTGRQLQSFKKNVDRPLAAILTLNTIAHTVGAIGVGAQAAAIWAEANPLITSVLVPSVMTLAILVLSEIIPKTFGATYWQALAPFTVNSLILVIAALYPLVWMSQLITRAMKKDKIQSVFSPSEFLAMAEIGVAEGHVQPQQSEIIQNLFELHAVPVKDVMTPRTVVTMAPENMTIREFFETNKKLPFSRIPLHEEGKNEAVTGYFMKDTMLQSLLHDMGEQSLSTMKRKITVVPDSQGIHDVFDNFLENQEQIALVVDEFGGMAGIVTMEDLIETLLGTEIIDEYDDVADMRAVAKRKWEAHVREHGLIGETGSE